MEFCESGVHELIASYLHHGDMLQLCSVSKTLHELRRRKHFRILNSKYAIQNNPVDKHPYSMVEKNWPFIPYNGVISSPNVYNASHYGSSFVIHAPSPLGANPSSAASCGVSEKCFPCRYCVNPNINLVFARHSDTTWNHYMSAKCMQMCVQQQTSHHQLPSAPGGPVSKELHSDDCDSQVEGHELCAYCKTAVPCGQLETHYKNNIHNKRCLFQKAEDARRALQHIK